MNAIACYLLAGAGAGLFSGMLGLGGGIIIVPLLVIAFTAQQITDPLVVPLAVGTSLASIVFTSLSSARAHGARGSVEWPLVRRMAPALVLGATLGATLAAHVSSTVSKIAFVVYCAVAATRMLGCGTQSGGSPVRGTPALTGSAFFVSVFATVLGIGGASFFVPMLTRCAMTARTAIGTACALTLPIAAAGAIAYVLHGLQASAQVGGTLGFVHLPALAGVAIGSMIAAPLGVAAAHRLPLGVLRKVFAVLLYVSAGHIFASVIAS
jgi:uncharacterized membrane protein YfcA